VTLSEAQRKALEKAREEERKRLAATQLKNAK